MASPYDKYARGKLLGAGSYGTATLFSTRDGKKVVIKEIDLSKLSPTDVKAAEGEVKVRILCSAGLPIDCTVARQACFAWGRAQPDRRGTCGCRCCKCCTTQTS